VKSKRASSWHRRFKGVQQISTVVASFALIVPLLPRTTDVLLQSSSKAPLQFSLRIPQVVMPLTTFKVKMRGLNPAQPVIIKFKGPSHYLSQQAPLAVTKSGVITGAVPLFVDPTTGQGSAADLTLVISQGSRSTRGLKTHVNDLPPLSDYGTPLGHISHMYLVYESLVIGTQISEFEGTQFATGIDPNASGVISTLTTQLKAVLLARNDVDRVMLNNSTVITGGIRADGSTITFDSNSVAMMDRIFGYYMIQQFGTAPQVSSSLRHQRLRLVHFTSAHVNAAGVIGVIGGLLDSYSTFQALSESQQADASNFNQLKSTLEGEAGAIAIIAKLPLGLHEADQVFAESVGAMCAIGEIAFAAGAVGIDLYNGMPYEADRINLFNKSADVLFAGLIKAYPNSTPGSTEIMGLNVAFTYYDQLLSGEIQSVVSASGQAASLLVGGETADLTGTVNIANSQGVAASQTSLSECCFGTSQIGIDSIADPSGGYDVPIPLGVAGTNYKAIVVTAYDLVTGTILGSSTYDLSSAMPFDIFTSTPIIGQCGDSDALSPDGDDPDCDSG
jgi:hypothetical protein